MQRSANRGATRRADVRTLGMVRAMWLLYSALPRARAAPLADSAAVRERSVSGPPAHTDGMRRTIPRYAHSTTTNHHHHHHHHHRLCSLPRHRVFFFTAGSLSRRGRGCLLRARMKPSCCMAIVYVCVRDVYCAAWCVSVTTRYPSPPCPHPVREISSQSADIPAPRSQSPPRPVSR